jgi:diguanylate cyclase (GGDEF)-like protein
MRKRKSYDQEIKEQEFRPSLDELDRNLARSRRGNVIGIVAVLVAIVAALLIERFPNAYPGASSAVDGLLLLILTLQIYSFTIHREVKASRNRVAQQLVIAVKHRLRADHLYDLSIVDPLTGLNNRRFGDQRLKQEVTRTERNNQPLAVLLLDLDGFKEINDQHGHAAGDLALREFSRCLRRAVRACDVPVRLGGDEFLVILPDCARENVEPILSRVGSPTIEFNGQTIVIGYSTGRAHYQIADTAEALLQRADKVLYEQKASRSHNRLLDTPVPSSSLSDEAYDPHPLVQ